MCSGFKFLRLHHVHFGKDKIHEDCNTLVDVNLTFIIVFYELHALKKFVACMLRFGGWGVPTNNIMKLDAYYFVSVIMVTGFLLWNTMFPSIGLTYVIVLVVLCLLLYGSVRYNSENLSLKDIWILAILSTIIYPFVDSIFAGQLVWVTYTTDDPKLLFTPIYVMLYWVYAVLLFGYLYLRLGSFLQKWIASSLTGIFAAIGATFFENLFNEAQFYQNAASPPMIMHIPLYVSLGWGLTFTLLPLFLKKKYLTGFMLYSYIGTCWLALHYVLQFFI